MIPQVFAGNIRTFYLESGNISLDFTGSSELQFSLIVKLLIEYPHLGWLHCSLFVIITRPDMVLFRKFKDCRIAHVKATIANYALSKIYRSERPLAAQTRKKGGNHWTFAGLLNFFSGYWTKIKCVRFVRECSLTWFLYHRKCSRNSRDTEGNAISNAKKMTFCPCMLWGLY